MVKETEKTVIFIKQKHLEFSVTLSQAPRWRHDSKSLKLTGEKDLFIKKNKKQSSLTLALMLTSLSSEFFIINYTCAFPKTSVLPMRSSFALALFPNSKRLLTCYDMHSIVWPQCFHHSASDPHSLITQTHFSISCSSAAAAAAKTTDLTERYSQNVSFLLKMGHSINKASKIFCLTTSEHI